MHRAFCINGTPPFDDFPIHGQFSAGPHTQQVARMHGIKRHIFVSLGCDKAGSLGGETQQRFDGATGALTRSEFEPLPEQHEHGDDGGRLET